MIPLFKGHVACIKSFHSSLSSILEASCFRHHLLLDRETSSLIHLAFIHSLSGPVLLVLGVHSRAKRAHEINLRGNVGVFYIIVRWDTGAEIGRIIGHFFRRFRKNLWLLLHRLCIPNWVWSLEASSPDKASRLDDHLLFYDPGWESPLARHGKSIIIIRRAGTPSTRLSVMILYVRFETAKEKRTWFSSSQSWLLFNANVAF